MQAKDAQKKQSTSALAAGLDELPTGLLQLLEKAEKYTSSLIKTQQRLIEEEQSKPRLDKKGGGGRQSARKSL